MSAATSSTPAAVPPQSPAAAGYFIDQKKGEVNELKQVVFEMRYTSVLVIRLNGRNM